jgi:hypothetical protein
VFPASILSQFQFTLKLRRHVGIFQDISLTQWLALTPPELVKAHLGFSDELISKLSKEKLSVV